MRVREKDSVSQRQVIYLFGWACVFGDSFFFSERKVVGLIEYHWEVFACDYKCGMLGCLAMVQLSPGHPGG